jgi:NAD(P)-dependent dehydrogenase (short-subunit alcohol dehydrogenase family)
VAVTGNGAAASADDHRGDRRRRRSTHGAGRHGGDAAETSLQEVAVGEFDDTIVLVTGCARARGMGRAISVAFARAGADVVATDVASGGTRNENEEGLEEVRLGWKGLESLAGEIEALGRRVLTLVGDVSRAADAERFVADALARFGRVDVLVNNAAAPHGADRRLLWEVPEEAWDLVIDVNLKGAFLMSRAVIPPMLSRGRGRIINMASVSGKRGTARRGAYTASKFGVIGLTQSLAQEVAAHGITVNAICPGSVDTSRRESTSRRERALVERDPNAPVLGLPPTGRIARPDDIARLALFFASPQSDHITGQAWNVDGGVVMH